MIHFQHLAFGLFRIHLYLYLGHTLTFICYIEVYYFSFAFLDCVCYNEDFIKLRFVIYQGFVPCCLIVILAGLKKIVCHTKHFVIWRFVKSRFYCSIVRPLKESPSGERQGTYSLPASISGCSLGIGARRILRLLCRILRLTRGSL